MSNYALKRDEFSKFGIFNFSDITIDVPNKSENSFFSDVLINKAILKNEDTFNENYYIDIINRIDINKNKIKDEYNFNPPNEYVLDFSKIFIKNLIKNKIQPDRITPSADEGICFIFRKDSIVLYFEIYNDKEMGYIIEDEVNKNILENKSIGEEKEIIKILLNFFR